MRVFICSLAVLCLVGCGIQEWTQSEKEIVALFWASVADTEGRFNDVTEGGPRGTALGIYAICMRDYIRARHSYAEWEANSTAIADQTIAANAEACDSAARL